MDHLTKAHAELIDGDTCIVTPDEEECMAAGPHGLSCTRAGGHHGPHVAHVEDEPVAMWVDRKYLQISFHRVG